MLKEIIQFSRDRVILLLILWLYTVEVVICSYALTFDVKHLPLVVVDFDRSVASRNLQEKFSVTEAFDLIGHAGNEEEAGGWLQSGEAVLALVIPDGFQRRLRRGESPGIQLLLDGSNSNTAAIARGYAVQILQRFHQEEIPGGATPGIGARPLVRVWYNPDQTFTSFMVLSMIALAALMVGMIHPAASIVREKEVGTIEQLMVTPISTGELFAAKTVPTLATGLLSVFPSLLIVWWFGVPLRGSLPLFLALTALFLLSAIAMGVLAAAISRTLQQALLLSFFSLFPIMFLSGTLVPVESMPDFLQSLSLLSPLRYYMDVILGVFLKGAGMAELWPQAAALLGIGVVLFGIALSVFRRQLT
ncbi:MAG TPA: ABC transporter permease [Gammaproteobacteria bacterium]|nr:ABC transporter permease [Gammaproteobacteria bacterium]